MNYLEWINQCTPTRWWHDSGNPDEIELALKRGATGVTTCLLYTSDAADE